MDTITSWPLPDRIIAKHELESADRLAPETAPNIYKIENIVIKTGDATRLAEALTMRAVREKTTIPVPKIYNAYLDNETGHGTIIMDYVEGEELRYVWDKLKPEERSSIIEQLRGYMEQLRSIEGSFIGSIDNTYCEDQLFTDDLGSYGPYEDENSFHEGIIKALRSSQEGPYTEMVADFIRALPQHRIVLTHSDFAPRNILVSQGKVVAILDWEMAGYYPEYWEYVKAYYRPDWGLSWFQDRVIDSILQPYPLEHAVLLHTRDIVW
jgi:tRNA A-37 threonylcarbamoyl transferase component Bud32